MNNLKPEKDTIFEEEYIRERRLSRSMHRESMELIDEKNPKDTRMSYDVFPIENSLAQKAKKEESNAARKKNHLLCSVHEEKEKESQNSTGSSQKGS